MEERLDHVRTEVTYILYCITNGRYIQGYADGIVTFNAFEPKRFKTLEEAIAAKHQCQQTIRNNSGKSFSISVRKWTASWTPGGKTKLQETTITL